MGNESSKSSSVVISTIQPYSGEMYMPFNASRFSDERQLVIQNSILENKYRAPVLKTAFCGIWSLETSHSNSPSPRTGHFTYHDEQNHTCYIGYGLDKKNKTLCDVWALDTETNWWSQIHLKGDVMLPRTGARCSKYGDYLIIFGGFDNPKYLSDLHAINVHTGEVKKIETTGDEPSQRAFPIVEVYKDKLFVWGGYNGEYPSELNVLDLKTMKWRAIPQEIIGRTGVPYAVIGNKLYSYGGSKTSGMVVIDLENETVDVKQVKGATPPSNILSAGMVAFDHYLLFFGGRAQAKNTIIYACDVNQMWWFVFYVKPDDQTVSLADGCLSETGIFMIPRIHSFSLIYVKDERKVCGFLGRQIRDSSYFFNISVGESLSVLHLREDMNMMLNF